MLKSYKKGFTLIELIIVISILGILSAVTIPKFTSYREAADLVADQSNAKIIGDALNYAYMNGDITYNSTKNKFTGTNSSGETVTFGGSGRSFEEIFVPDYIDKMILDDFTDSRLYIFSLSATDTNIEVEISFDTASDKYAEYGDLVLYTINIAR
jgi:prepilin-type N-terminal cleavage/methylation domain-containing protein